MMGRHKISVHSSRYYIAGFSDEAWLKVLSGTTYLIDMALSCAKSHPIHTDRITPCASLVGAASRPTMPNSLFPAP